MKERTQTMPSRVLLGLCLIGLALALTQCKSKPAPAEETAMPTAPAVSQAATVVPSATAPPITPSAAPAPTATPTEGERVAAAVGRQFDHYFSTVAECSRAVENQEVKGCVAPDSIRLITRPEWEQLFPNTHFYVVGFVGRDQEPLYNHSYRRRLAAWQDGRYYSAETFHRLLDANGVEITDENRELVARAFALMTLPDYLGEEIVFIEWGKVDMQPARHNYNYCLTAWTRIQGLELKWCFVFKAGRLEIATGIQIVQSHVGDFIDDVPFGASPEPSFFDYRFTGE